MHECEELGVELLIDIFESMGEMRFGSQAMSTVSSFQRVLVKQSRRSKVLPPMCFEAFLDSLLMQLLACHRQDHEAMAGSGVASPQLRPSGAHGAAGGPPLQFPGADAARSPACRREWRGPPRRARLGALLPAERPGLPAPRSAQRNGAFDLPEGSEGRCSSGQCSGVHLSCRRLRY